MTVQTISEELMDALREIINIGVGRAAGTLNELLGCYISLDVPQVNVIYAHDLGAHLSKRTVEPVALVMLQFRGPFSGISTLMFTADNASKLVNLLVDEDLPTDDLDAIKTGTLTEVGNILLNAVMGSISNMLQMQLSYTIPTYQEGPPGDVLQSILRNEKAALEVITRFNVKSRQIMGEFLLLFEVGAFDEFIVALEKALSGQVD